MVETTQFPDLVTILRTFLTPYLPGVHVASKIPNPRKPRMVRLELAGGYGRNIALSKRNVIVQCWDESEPAAVQLAEKVSALLFASPRSVPLVRYVDSLGEPTNFPDPATSLPRYQFTVTVTVRGLVSTTE